MPEPKSCSDPAYENLEISMKNLREKISVASQDTKSAYSNQTTLATYNVFIASREAIHRDIEKYSKYNDILQKIKKARITLDESRKINALKMIEQRRESDALLRMQMEQKMHLMQQQQIELECYKQSIMEKRLRELTLEPDNSNQNYALPPQNQPNLNYYPQPMNMNQPFYEGFQPQIPVHPQSSNYQYPVRISQEQFQNIPSNQQQGVNQVIPSQTQPPQHPDIEELISFDPIPKNP